jgi:hypothetical protein
MAIESKKVRVTPDQAAAWLRPEVNHDNRSLRHEHVVYLANEILHDRWQVTNQGLGFSETGRLLDGQHRLSAIVRAGKAVDILVTTGLEEEAFRAIDCGLKRANYDRIHLVNDDAQNRLICMGLRTYVSEVTKTSTISVGQLEDEFLTKTAAWMWVGQEFVMLNARLKKAGIVASFAIYHHLNPDKASEFMVGYREGAGLQPDSPILTLREAALTGTHYDTRYWRVQTLMHAHLEGEPVGRVYEASEDLLGNENTSRVVQARSARASRTNRARAEKERASA